MTVKPQDIVLADKTDEGIMVEIARLMNENERLRATIDMAAEAIERGSTSAPILEILRAAISALERAPDIAAERERCMKAVCVYCAHDEPAQQYKSSITTREAWAHGHPNNRCAASAIRDLPAIDGALTAGKRDTR